MAQSSKWKQTAQPCPNCGELLWTRTDATIRTQAVQPERAQSQNWCTNVACRAG